MYTIDAGLYWLLPDPRSFINKIATRVNTARVLVVNLPRTMVPGTHDGIVRGLSDAHIRDPIRLVIRSGTDIASDVGAHFSNRRLTAGQLADYHAATQMAVILQAENDVAQTMCEQYTIDFMAATEHCHGNVHLVTTIHHRANQSDSQIGKVQLITFDGGLTSDEMDAYVALRMVNRPGPGTTRLLRTIVSEFAGFDAQFAERLMHMEDSQILGIRDQLSLLVGEDPDRWRTLDWLTGTNSIVSSTPHVLHDFYVSEHGLNDQKEDAKERISRRYWRACLKSITPWLEERRSEVLRYFYPKLVQIAAADPSGKIPVPTGNNRFRYVEPDEIEFNSIVGLFYSKKLSANSPPEQKALNICMSTKPVRDAIAHMRAPSSADLFNLIHGMDALIGI
jgi:hypothetical protein